jgi:hypothetical protein
MGVCGAICLKERWLALLWAAWVLTREAEWQGCVLGRGGAQGGGGFCGGFCLKERWLALLPWVVPILVGQVQQ